MVAPILNYQTSWLGNPTFICWNEIHLFTFAILASKRMKAIGKLICRQRSNLTDIPRSFDLHLGSETGFEPA